MAVIRILNYLLFIVTFVWAGMDFLVWGQPGRGLAVAAACCCSGALMRHLYLRAR